MALISHSRFQRLRRSIRYTLFSTHFTSFTHNFLFFNSNRYCGTRNRIELGRSLCFIYPSCGRTWAKRSHFKSKMKNAAELKKKPRTKTHRKKQKPAETILSRGTNRRTNDEAPSIDLFFSHIKKMRLLVPPGKRVVELSQLLFFIPLEIF